MLAYLPNSLTVLRLLLAFPLGLLILREEYVWALGVGCLAGVSDALDGYFARRLGVFSRIGAALDPIADKMLIMVSFVSLAQMALIPWYLAIAVILRDLVIVAGAACYYLLIGPFEFAATRLSKSNMFIQISFCVLILLSQVVPGIPAAAAQAGALAVLVIAAMSGIDYVMSWTVKAVRARKTED
jgi:cardiolipin synthase (CMP-forming)